VKSYRIISALKLNLKRELVPILTALVPVWLT